MQPDARFPTDYRDALLEGDRLAFAGRHAALIRSLTSQRGFDVLEQTGFQGFLDSGIPQSGSLFNGEVALFAFEKFPGSTGLQIDLHGTGDADLLVAPAEIFDPNDPNTFAFPQLAGSNESISLDASTRPSVDDGDAWLIFVGDFPDDEIPSTYTVVVNASPPAPSISIGNFKTDRLAAPGEIDLVSFLGIAGQIVRLEVTPQTQGLGLAAGILDPADVTVLAADSDSGPNATPLIQGVVLPMTKTYTIGVPSPFGDIDPTAGIGDYRIDLSLCNNQGPDFDGDGLSNACDDDDDDDGFKDGADTAPRDPSLCTDQEPDQCDDCSSGSFDLFNDGPDFDGDALCDAGDPDDDNDGCEDAIDPAPFQTSGDGDFDFIGLDCDNCPNDFNPDQRDRDGDGLGDVCDPTPVPEPAGLLLSLTALATLALLRRGRRRF